MKLFIDDNDGIGHFYKNYIGLIDDKLKFIQIRALSQGERFQPYEKLNPYYEAWVKTMDDINSESPAGINNGVMTGGRYFTWMRSEKEFLYTAQTGILISMAFSFIILNLSTLNIFISIFSIICIGLIVLSVVAVMELLGWEFGVAESIAVVILIGFSVDYVVHLANHYVESPFKNRHKRI